VIIIEHNLDVIRNADWILDLGPEGGEDGGQIVGQGRPAQIAATPGSYTGQFLKRYYTSSNGKLTSLELETGADAATDESAGANDLALSRRDGLPPPAPVKAKRKQRATPAEEDLAAARTKARRPVALKTGGKSSGPRTKKTGLA
jgi:excinuclease ABC subunit A